MGIMLLVQLRLLPVFLKALGAGGHCGRLELIQRWNQPVILNVIKWLFPPTPFQKHTLENILVFLQSLYETLQFEQ